MSSVRQMFFSFNWKQLHFVVAVQVSAAPVCIILKANYCNNHELYYKHSNWRAALASLCWITERLILQFRCCTSSKRKQGGENTLLCDYDIWLHRCCGEPRRGTHTDQRLIWTLSGQTPHSPWSPTYPCLQGWSFGPVPPYWSSFPLTWTPCRALLGRLYRRHWCRTRESIDASSLAYNR